MSSRIDRRVLVFGLIAGGALLVSGCAGSPVGPEAPVTRQADRMGWLWSVFVWTAVFIGLLVWGLIIWSIIRYRKTPQDVQLPRQFRNNVPLEILYTGVPVIIVIGLFIFTARVINDVNHLAASPDLVVEVTAFQWDWQFNYPDHGITITGSAEQEPVLVVPTNQTVRLELTSKDVVHSFFVPAFLEKRDIFPGTVQQIDLEVTEPGTYQGRCAEFCGIYHDRMLFQVEALSPAEFESWIAAQTSKEGQ
jgi:cytochrome c oxidase subunit 2